MSQVNRCLTCKHYITHEINDTVLHGCDVTHCFSKYFRTCSYESEDELEKANICYNCKHWIGGGDFGLSCAKHYYITNANGFIEACEDFEGRK